MVLKKCSKCNKNITKTKPALICSRCDKSVHADPACVKLSNKQINTLRNSPGIEWSCEDCLQNASRRSSYLIPDDDEGDDESDAGSHVQAIDTIKLVRDISRELKKTFREEISSLQTSMDFLGDQITSMEQSIKKQDNVIKDLEKKNQDLLNRNKNLELRVNVIEQGMNSFEQRSLSSSLEVAGLPNVPPTDVPKVLEVIASKLKVNINDMQSSSRLPGSKDKPGAIILEMKSASTRNQWITASKEKRLTVGAIMPNFHQDQAENPVYLRAALTKYLKTLLYTTKSQLGKSYQFIWIRDEKVCVRKTSDSKIFYIRSIHDINRIPNNHNELK